MTHRSAPLPTYHSITPPSWRLAILFTPMSVVINFASYTRLVLVGRGQRAPEGNTTVGRVEDTPPLLFQSVKLYTAQYTGQKRCTQRKISGKKALSSTKYRMKTAQYNGQKHFTQHNVPGKETSNRTKYWTKNLHTTQYTGQKLFKRHNIPDKRFIQHIKRDKNRVKRHKITDNEALHSTKYRTRRHYREQYTRQKRFIQHNLLAKRFIQHNVSDKTLYTAQYTGQKYITQHNIPDKNALYRIIYWPNSLHSTVYRTKMHHKAQYTGQNTL
jgi:hypothetical protein